ncbi:MAG TPA: hypothetical protein VGF97_01440 [Rhizomicrobium sp.]
MKDATANLIDGVRLSDFEADLHQGDGNELAGKFRADHSSSALAVNSFAPFKAAPEALRLQGEQSFSSLCFERKCPHGLAGRRSPNLDVFAEGPAGIVAIESKCLEPMTPHIANFAPAYDAEIRDARRATPWFRQMHMLSENPRQYRWLDAAQLVKHAFGIAYSFPDRPTTLLYLYWEPTNPDEYPFFKEHRDEVARFASSTAGSAPAFAAMSYPQLWRHWSHKADCGWLRAHVDRLNARYSVAV